MSHQLLFLIGVVGVAVGLVGVVVPVVPGLLLVWLATLGTLLLDGSASVTDGAILTVLAAAGTAASYLLPARRISSSGVPRSSMVAAVVGAIVGFFVVPLFGLVIGGVGALLVAEQRRTGDLGAAWRSSRQVLAMYGVGVLLELVAGILMGGYYALTWIGAG